MVKGRLLHMTPKDVACLWPCFNCKSLFEVSKQTFSKLRTGTLSGVQCPDCLPKPPKPGLRRAS